MEKVTTRKFKFPKNPKTGKRERVFEGDTPSWVKAEEPLRPPPEQGAVQGDHDAPPPLVPSQKPPTVTKDGQSVTVEQGARNLVVDEPQASGKITPPIEEDYADLGRPRNPDGSTAGLKKVIRPQPQPTKPNYQIHCFYHYDLDGCAAAAIVRTKLPWAIMHPIEYDYKVLEPTASTAEVIFVDFTPRLADLTEMTRVGNRHVVWIDHHQTALQAMSGQGFDKLPGLRSTEHSGAWLTWKFFYEHLPVPRSIELIDLWDTWKHEDSEDVLWFKSGIEIFDSSPKSKIWDEILCDGQNDVMERITQAGRCISEHFKIYWKQCVDMYGFECRFRHLRYGKLRCFALFLPDSSSLAFASKPGYDIYLSLVYNGKQYRVSMYAGKPGIDVSEIAKSYGGGGHAGAADFSLDELPLTADATFDGTNSPAASTRIPAAIGGR